MVLFAHLCDHAKKDLKEQDGNMARFTLTLDIETPGPERPQAEHLYAALEAALDAASRDPAPMLAKIETAFDPGPAWVIRKADPADMILDGQHGEERRWIPTIPGDVPETAKHVSGEGKESVPLLLTTLPKGAVWCREDLLDGEPVLAEIYSDTRFIERDVDIRPWLMEAAPEDILDLAEDDWDYGERADQVAYALESAGDPSAIALFHYLGLHPTTASGDTVGFEVDVDSEAAVRWLRENRPDVHAALALSDGAPDGP